MSDPVEKQMFELPPQDRSTWRRLVKIMLNYKQLLILGVILTILRAVVGGGAFPILAERVIHAVEKHSQSGLNFWCLIAFPIFLVRGAIIFFQVWQLNRATQRIIADMRESLFVKMLSLSYRFFQKSKTGELVSRVTNDLQLMQNFVTMAAQDFLQVPIQILVGFGLCFYYSWQLTMFSLLVVPFLAALISRFGKLMRSVTQTMQRKMADVASVVQETIVAISVVKAFTTENYEERRFNRENEETLRVTMKSIRLRAMLQPLVELVGATGALCGLWFGGYLVITGKMQLSTLVGFMFGVNLIYQNINRIPGIAMGVQQSLAASDRLFEVLDSDDKIPEKPDAVAIERIEGAVEFDNVMFEYNPNRPALRNVSVRVEPDTIVALVGSTGAGKSTFVNMIPRFYDVTGGAVRVDGRDIRDLTINSLRRHIGIVPQDTMLFAATLRQNIAYGSERYSEADLISASKAAHAHEFIEKLPKGYETRVGERGVTLSGGQRQRVAIARAILRNPRILILDEATSNVDNQSEALIQAALEKLMKGRTTFVIAHRLSTVRHADIILVLDDGQIVESGSHDELYELGGVYRRLYDRGAATTKTLDPPKKPNAAGEQI